MPHSVLAVANRFLQLGQRDKVPLTPMHLQKLCYLAQGFSLAFLEEPLIADPVEAWDYGPVYSKLYDALKGYGSGPVTELISENNWASSPMIRGPVVTELFTLEEDGIIQSVYDTYASYPAFQLSALTHEDGSPWHQMFNRGERNVLIPNELTREYFRGLAA